MSIDTPQINILRQPTKCPLPKINMGSKRQFVSLPKSTNKKREVSDFSLFVVYHD